MKNLFINRKLELEKLSSGLKKHKDYVLIAPRRFGKTALSQKVLEQLSNQQKCITISIDLMSYTSGSIQSVAECIIEKSLNALGFAGKLRKFWNNLDFTMKIRMKYHDLEIEPLLSMFKHNNEWALLEEALQLPEKIAKKENIPVIVFYDEFGELHKQGIRIIELFRSVIQQHKKVSYLFAGSQETIMNKIFLEKSGAFYRFGEIIQLRELDKEDIYQYIVSKYPKLGLHDSEQFKIIDTLISILNGHPYYTAMAIDFFEEHPTCKYEQFVAFLTQDLLERERPLLEQQLIEISKKQHATDTLRIISMGLNPYSELKPVSQSQIYTTIRYLENGGYIQKEQRGVYKPTDPLLAMLLNRY